MQVDKSASVQLEIAAAYIDVLPNRIASAQSSAMESVKRKAPNELAKIAKAARHLDFAISKHGPVGIKMTVRPSKKKGSGGKHGYNLQIATAVLLTGRRGGRIVRPKQAKAMKVRPQSVQKGYSPYYKLITLGPIRSRKKEIKDSLKKLVLGELRNKFKLIGIGARGGVSAKTDFSSTRSV